MNPSRIALAITTVVSELSGEQLLSLAKLVGEGTIQSDSPVSSLEDTLAIHGSQLQAVTRLLRSWEGPPVSLAAALLAGLGIRRGSEEGRDITSVIWTVPVGLPTPARSTFAVTKEMVESAKQNVTVLGYRVHSGAKPIFEVLAERSSHGVRVQMVLDKAAEQLGVLSKLWPGHERIDIYSSQSDAILHAKLTVVDGRDMLVTSANLTGHGLRSNIEVGVRIRGPSAYSAYLLINKLINDGHFVRVGL